MSLTKEKTYLVEKEKVSSLVFPEESVHKNDASKKQVEAQLQTACDYGNLAQHKVEIVFKDNESRKKVYTTIWEVKDGLVYLKHNLTIPINRILEVKA